MNPVKPSENKADDRISLTAKPTCGINRDAESGEFFENVDIGLLSIEAVAATLGRAPQTIRNWISKRQFPFVKIGGKHWVRRESLLIWLKSKEIKSWE